MASPSSSSSSSSATEIRRFFGGRPRFLATFTVVGGELVVMVVMKLSIVSVIGGGDAEGHGVRSCSDVFIKNGDCKLGKKN